ncbi:hypothetical protein [Paractinoplanes maris]|uniref:hypothetical protein n=1 Tax=Paractinoplanes maris TaxID=1734446 RepID=UPI002021C273|nr:hypothetical protein [Actinoplanes maris]
MEPVPVTRKVRRIVRMAVALVVGQAMLCAVIGWLTLGPGRSEPTRAPGSAVVDQLAAPPLIAPAAPTSRAATTPAASTAQARKPVPATTRTAPRRPPAATTTAASRSPDPTTPPSTTPAQPDPVAIVIPPPPPVPPAPSTEPSPITTTATPVPSTSSAPVQQPVRVGDECRPAGAYGRTLKGELVRCLREWGQRPRWKIV